MKTKEMRRFKDEDFGDKWEPTAPGNEARSWRKKIKVPIG